MGQPAATHEGDDAVPAVHALHLAELVGRWGVARSDLLRGLVREAKLHDPAARLSAQTIERLVARARDLTGERALGLHLGLQMRVSAHGYLGFAAMAASTVGEALALAIRFAPTRTTALALRLEVTATTAALVIEERADFGTARDVVLIALLVGLWQIGEAITGRPLGGRSEFAFAAPDYRARLGALANASFGRRDNRLVFARTTLALPLTMADPVALELARAQCEGALDALGETRLGPRVRAVIPGGERGFRSLTEVSRALGFSVRTLKRRLAEEGQSFSRLLAEERAESATALLRRADISLDEVADRLGYSDPANFGRAFRKWTGSTPAAHRRALRAEARGARSRGAS